MSKVVSDKDYLERYLFREHYPTTRDIGSQLDPEVIIICKCWVGAPNNVIRETYNQHLVRLLNEEYKFLDLVDDRK